MATASQRQQEPAVVNQTDTAARNVGDEEVVHDVLTQPKAGSINNDIFKKGLGGCFFYIVHSLIILLIMKASTLKGLKPIKFTLV